MSVRFRLALPVLKDTADCVTGWWPHGTIEKMRQLTLEGIDACVSFKKQVSAASASENPPSCERSEGTAAETSGSKPANTGSPDEVSPTEREVDRLQSKTLPANLSRNAFRRRVMVVADTAKIVKAPPPAATTSSAGSRATRAIGASSGGSRPAGAAASKRRQAGLKATRRREREGGAFGSEDERDAMQEADREVVGSSVDEDEAESDVSFRVGVV